jgi:uncharacterized RDD family membrane protein YckC
VSTPAADGADGTSGLPYPEHTPRGREDLPDHGPGAPAPWGLRATARIIDLVVVLVPATLLAEAFGVRRDDEGLLVGPMWPRLIFPSLFIAYELVTTGVLRRSVGKFLCRITVVQWTTGAAPTPRQGLVRGVVAGIWFLLALIGGVLGYLVFVPVVVYLTSIADSLYRGVHDKAAGTIVLADPQRGRVRPE